LCEQRQIAGQMKRTMLKGGLKSGDELAAKHTAEHMDGERKKRGRDRIQRV
jgi:hypothetical protein